jgi:hypothetical protein
MRQGKLSELIHNSGVIVEADENAAPAQDVEGAEFEDDASLDEEEYDTGKKKKGGKKGKGKKSAPAASEAGLIGQCTVEVWFREIIDLVSRSSWVNVKRLLTLSHYSPEDVTTSKLCPTPSSSLPAPLTATTRVATREPGFSLSRRAAY